MRAAKHALWTSANGGMEPSPLFEQLRGGIWARKLAAAERAGEGYMSIEMQESEAERTATAVARLRCPLRLRWRPRRTHTTATLRDGEKRTGNGRCPPPQSLPAASAGIAWLLAGWHAA